METLIEKINRFVAVENHYGYGYGSGSGYGYGYVSGTGDGSGSGTGYGDGSGYGYGYGYGSGSSYGDGSGYGYGYGSGSGTGYGDGDGYGSGYGIKSINGENIYNIDGVPTIIKQLHNNIAKGYIVNLGDFSQRASYIVRVNNCFAHGDTLKQAMNDVQEKLFEGMDVVDRITEFRKIFNNKDKYIGSQFFDWHHKLTGSCLAGRKHFVQSHGYSLRKKYTVKEFIAMCEDSYGWQVIKELKNYYK